MQSTQSKERRYSAEMTLADLVQRDHRLSSILDRHGLSYCCRGTQTLSEACAENGLDTDLILSELTLVKDEPLPAVLGSDSKMRDILGLLFERYEPMLQSMLPSAAAKLQKVVGSHGDAFPQTMEAADAMDQLADELVLHLARGKQVLYPRVVEILRLREQGGEELAQTSKSSLDHLLQMLRAEIRVIRRYLSDIRDFTSQYSVPEGVCMTFTVSYRELASFDRMLSQFLAMEQEVLIPRFVVDPRNWR